jgi:hypothetical protein
MNPSVRASINREEFDYQVLKSALGAYASPRDKITSLLRTGDIVRVKKGLYVFGKEHRRRPICRELLANLIFGPSFVSLDYALGFHGLIPEQVHTITSVTTGRSRKFDTPIGRFVYRQTPCLSTGFDRVEDNTGSFLIATKERALADKIRDRRGTPITTMRKMEEYLFEDLRIDRDGVAGMRPETMRVLAQDLNSRKVVLCAHIIERNQRKK